MKIDADKLIEKIDNHVQQDFYNTDKQHCYDIAMKRVKNFIDSLTEPEDVCPECYKCGGLGEILTPSIFTFDDELVQCPECTGKKPENSDVLAVLNELEEWFSNASESQDVFDNDIMSWGISMSSLREKIKELRRRVECGE